MNYCKDCRFYNNGWSISGLDNSCICQPGGTMNLITGEYQSTGKKNAYEMRSDANLCGPSAIYFIAKEKPVILNKPEAMPTFYRGY